MLKPDIEQHEAPAAADIDFVLQRFRAFNAAQGGTFPKKDLHLFAYGPDREIIGGLFGDISWGWLHVDVIWVAESARHEGVGTALMDQAEAEAEAMGVHHAYLETTDFQGLDFYKKRGYTVFAHLENQPPGHRCYYLKKEWQPGSLTK